MVCLVSISHAYMLFLEKSNKLWMSTFLVDWSNAIFIFCFSGILTGNGSFVDNRQGNLILYVYSLDIMEGIKANVKRA